MNKVNIIGTSNQPFEFDYELNNERFYRGEISVERSSGAVDYIPVIVSNRVIDNSVLFEYPNGIYNISGSFRSKKIFCPDQKCYKKELYLFANTMELIKGDNENYTNQILLTGEICKKFSSRNTSSNSERKIVNFVVKVDRNTSKNDYIPCLLWGRNATYMDQLEVGTKVCLEGRIQSRNCYVVKNKGTENEIREDSVSIEVSCNSIALLEEE